LGGRYTKLGAHISPKQNEQYRKAAMITCLVLFPLFFYQIFWHYREKNRWYFRI
jgi:hypothetical protein